MRSSSKPKSKMAAEAVSFVFLISLTYITTFTSQEVLPKATLTVGAQKFQLTKRTWEYKSNGYTYSINIFEKIKDCKGAKVCKSPNVNLGSKFNSSLSADGSGFTLQFGDGTCESKSKSDLTTLLQFKCGKYMGSPRLIDEHATSKACIKIFEFVTNEACNSAPKLPEVPCYLYNNSKKIDLTPLIKTEGGHEVTSDDSSHNFYINVCRDIKPEKGSGSTAKCPGGAACRTDKTTAAPIGSVSTQSIPVLSSNGEVVMFYNTTKKLSGCAGFASTKITFVCPQYLHRVSGKGPVMTSTDNCMYEVFWETEYACPQADLMSSTSCILSNQFVDFDLTPLQKPTGHNYRVQDKDKKYTYYINVCKPTNIPNCIPSGYNASVCQEIADSNQVLSLGVYYEETLTYADGQLVLSYKGGKTCHNGFQRETIINFICNPTVEQGSPVFSGELIHCVYFFKWETRYACPPTRRTGSACRATRNGHRYDLSELISPNGSNWLTIDGESSSSSKMLYVNVCGKLNKQTATTKCNSASAACLIDKKDGSVKNLGRYYTPPVLNPDNSLTLNYTEGDECIKGVKRRTVITFVCHHGDLTSPPILVSHSQDDCEYTIMWKTAVACPLGVNLGRNCKVEDKVAGYVFDLNAMQTHPVVGKYYSKVHVGKYIYYLKVCKDVNDTQIHCVNASACQEDPTQKPPKVQVTGRPNSDLYYYDGVLRLQYTGGDKCNNGKLRETHIAFICKPDATSQGDGIPEFDREDHCVYHFRWPTKYACPAQTIECAARSNDNQYDLSSLVKTDDNWQSSSHVGTFYINVCRSLNLKPEVSQCLGTSAICLKESNGDIHNLGRVDSALKVTTQGTITITYTKGDRCSTDTNKLYQSEILFICKKGATDTAPVYQSTGTDKCTYKFRWETAAACAIINVVGANCSVQDPKSDTTFNLYPLRRPLDTPYTYAHPDGRLFTLNVCGTIKKDLCKKDKDNDVDVGVCLTETDKTKLNLGVVSQQLAFEGETLVLTYRDGDRDVVNGFPRITKIRFYCDPTIPLGIPKYIEQASEKDGEVFYFEFKTSLACSAKQVQCLLTSSNGDKYDLTPLGLITGNWEAVDTRSKYKHLHYFINVCRPINPLPSSIKCPGGAIGACQIDHTLSKGHNLGYIQSNPIIASKNVVTLRYYGGDGCHSKYNRSTRINLSCSNFTGSPIFESETSDCEYVFSWQTPGACLLTRESGTNCAVTDRQYGYRFDLSPLKGKPFSVNVPGGMVHFSVCSKSSECTSSKPGSNSAACFVKTNHKDATSLGDMSTEVTYFDQEISLHYNISTCSLQITFECDLTQHHATSIPKFESVQKLCSYYIRWPTDLVCRRNTHVQCSKRIESSDKKTDLQYDFTPLSKPFDNWKALAKGSSKTSFWINVCRPVVQTDEASQCPPTAGVCKVDDNPSNPGTKRYMSLGSLTSGPVTEGSSIYLLYTGGDKCPNGKNASTKIRMQCGKYAEAAPIELNEYKDSCQYEFLWLTKYACPINTANETLNDDCTAVNPVTNYKFDLNKLSGTTDYQVTGQNNRYYLLNVCKALVDKKATPCGKTSGSCQLSKDSTSYNNNAGNVDKHLAYVDGVLRLTYTGGKVCKHSKTARTTIISFVCNSTTSNDLGKPVFVDESDDCSYYFSWHTKLACERKVECSPIVYGASTNTKYNLYKLANDDHNWLVIPSSGSNQGSTFYINICKALVPMKGINCPAGASACMKSKDGKPQSLGRAKDPPKVLNGKIVIEYYNGDNQVSSRIELTCNRGSLGQPRFVSKDKNVYTFTWATSAACPEEDVPDLKHCRVYDKSTEFYYDLSSLKLVSNKFITLNKDKGSTVYATVCGSLPTSGCDGAGVCWRKDKNAIKLGLYQYMTMAYLHDENMLLMKYCDMDCSSSNAKVVSRIMFICDESTSNTDTFSLDSIDASGANIIWKTNLVCPPAQEQCVFNDNGILYDLQLLSSRTKSWHYTTIKRDKYWINICRGINDQPGCPHYATVCAQLGDDKKILVLGYGKTQHIDKSTPSDKQILVHYTGQTNVPGCTHTDQPAQVMFQMICGKHVGKPTLKHVDQLSCTFTFLWTTVAACPIGSQKKELSMSNCRATHPVTNRIIDFTKIDNGPFTVTGNKDTYKFRICGKLPTSLGESCTNKWVCKNGNTGYDVTTPKLYYEDYAFELWLVTKTACDSDSSKYVTFIINFQCSANFSKPVFEYESASCHYVFTMSTPIVCTKDQSGNVIDTANSKSTGSSAGKKAGIAFAVILVLLLVAAVVFVLHNQRRRQALVLFVRANVRKVRRNGDSSNAVYKYQKITVENEDDVDLLLGFSEDEDEEEEDVEHRTRENDQDDEEMITI